MQNRTTNDAESAKKLLARLPAVSRLLEDRALAPLLDRCGATLVTDLLREHLEGLRAAILNGTRDAASIREAVEPARVALALATAADALLAPRPRAVINATGVVVHTNLGRSTLSAAAAAGLAESSRTYQDLEYDVGEGRRGNRLACLEPLMQRLFPEQAFAVTNNNAAAILLCLRALGRGKQVLVSRGELVEIGGSFRIPDIMAASGAELCEVGTTNRTRLADYEQALSADTGLLLKVHTSNFRIVGFAEEAGIAELAELARGAGLPLVVDWGSGDLVDLEPLAIRDELPVARVLAEGAHLVTFSADKLMGGPQAGIIVGERELVERVRKDPLARVCRLDRLRLGALQRTLAAYVRGTAFEEVPTLAMLALEPAEIEGRAKRVLQGVEAAAGQGATFEIVDGVSRTGGGSSPTGERPTRLLAVSVPGSDAGSVERRLREGEPPVVARVQDGRLLLDLRTVLPEQDEALIAGLVAALA